jgi:opacity protein-like surface antigen
VISFEREYGGIIMKKFVVASFALTALIAAPAVAADLGVKAPSVPYVPPLYNWSGCYLGVHGGAGVHHSDWTDEDFGEGTGIGAVGGVSPQSNTGRKSAEYPLRHPRTARRTAIF